MAMLRPSTSAATARHLEDEEGEAEPAGARKPGPRLRTSRGLGAPRASDGDGTGCRCARPGRRPNRAPEEAEAAAAAAAEGDDHDAITRARLRGLPRLPPAGEIRRYGWLESGAAMRRCRDAHWHPRRLFDSCWGQLGCDVAEAEANKNIPVNYGTTRSITTKAKRRKEEDDNSLHLVHPL